VLRQGLDDLDEANQAVAEALVWYPDREIRLTEKAGAVLLSAAPSRTSTGTLGPPPGRGPRR
jgi:hypothetical protein